VLTTDQKGSVAEFAIAHAAIKLGVDVYRPLTDGGRYDLILGLGSKLLRVQCKWAPLRGDVVVVRCHSTRRARDGLRKRCYTASEVDVIVAYCPELERCFLLCPEQFDGHPQVNLRTVPSRNNQRIGVNWADDFDFGARLVALLGP
jgi:hypothetical protein